MSALKVFECVPCAHLAGLRCAGSSCGLSVGEQTCPLQEALISFAQAAPQALSAAWWTVPKCQGGEPVLLQHGDL